MFWFPPICVSFKNVVDRNGKASNDGRSRDILLHALLG
jgi:hypothetical protein